MIFLRLRRSAGISVVHRRLGIRYCRLPQAQAGVQVRDTRRTLSDVCKRIGETRA